MGVFKFILFYLTPHMHQGIFNLSQQTCYHCVCTRTSIYIYIYMHTPVCTCTCTQVCVCVCGYLFLNTLNACVQVCVHVCKCVCMCVSVHVWIPFFEHPWCRVKRIRKNNVGRKLWRSSSSVHCIQIICPESVHQHAASAYCYTKWQHKGVDCCTK